MMQFSSTYDVYVADFVEPERVGVGSGRHEVSLVQSVVDFLGGTIQLVKDPLFDEGLLSSRLRYRKECERGVIAAR